MLHHRAYTPNFCFHFTGKEKDSETGYSYFGARYLEHELMTGWLSVDPMSDKYPSLSPYAYCAWNPVKLVDPEGREVYVTGDEADRVVEQLQTGNMMISRSVDGLLSVDIQGKDRNDLSVEEKLIYDAINSKEVTVHVYATKSAEIDGNHYFFTREEDKLELNKSTSGGSNLGSYLNHTGKKADSYCFIDIDFLTKNGFDQGVAHEISECYLAGLLSIKNQQNNGPALQGESNPLLMQAHISAIPEKVPVGSMYQFGVRFGGFGKIKK